MDYSDVAKMVKDKYQDIHGMKVEVSYNSSERAAEVVVSNATHHMMDQFPLDQLSEHLYQEKKIIDHMLNKVFLAED